jgi:hypothetical protein
MFFQTPGGDAFQDSHNTEVPRLECVPYGLLVRDCKLPILE